MTVVGFLTARYMFGRKQVAHAGKAVSAAALLFAHKLLGRRMGEIFRVWSANPILLRFWPRHATRPGLK